MIEKSVQHRGGGGTWLSAAPPATQRIWNRRGLLAASVQLISTASASITPVHRGGYTRRWRAEERPPVA
jgi:hypothetical protein